MPNPTKVPIQWQLIPFKNQPSYMDDSMDSVPTDAQGIELYHQLNELYQKTDTYPHKWLSNSVKVLEHIPVQKRATNVQLDQSNHLPGVKTLGLQWLSNEDVFTFNGQLLKNNLQPTKRNFLKRKWVSFVCQARLS